MRQSRLAQLALACALLATPGCTESSRGDEHDASAFDFSEGHVVTVASTTQMGIIRDSMEDGLTVSNGYAVRADDHDFAHYIAAYIVGGEQGHGRGLWFMTDGMDVPGEAYAVNGNAREFSNLPPQNENGDEELPDEVSRLFEVLDIRVR